MPRPSPGTHLLRFSAAELKRLVGGKVVTATIAATAIGRLPVAPETERAAGPGEVTVTFGADDAAAAVRLVADLAAGGIDLGDLDIASPSLDDVFTHLTPTGARP